MDFNGSLFSASKLLAHYGGRRRDSSQPLQRTNSNLCSGGVTEHGNDSTENRTRLHVDRTEMELIKHHGCAIGRPCLSLLF